MNDAYKKSMEELLEELKTDPEKGLSLEEAEKRLDRYGPNQLEEQEAKKWYQILFEKVNNIIVYLLGAAAILSLFFGDYVEALAIFIAILVSVVTGFIVELRAAKSVQALQEMVLTSVNVLRDGQIKNLESSQLVPGDIMRLKEDDAIAADGRIISSNNFAAIESALTGESEAVDKHENKVFDEDVPLGDRVNMVYSGTASTRGNASVVVTSTGMDTEVGHISRMLDRKSGSATPLDREVHRLGQVLLIIASVAAIAVVIAGFITSQEPQGLIQMAIILAVAAIPEALPAVQTITLARGMETMAEHKALVKTLPAVETLGSTSVIATDKTGTLTENQMMVANVILKDDRRYTVSGEGYRPEGEFLYKDEKISLPDFKEAPGPEIGDEREDFIRLIVYGMLSSNAVLEKEESGEEYRIDGDPTDGALTVLAHKAGLDREILGEMGWERQEELPFDSSTKYMGVIVKGNGKKLILKGAPDVIAEMADLEDREKEYWEESLDSLARQGMRVIMLAGAGLEDTDDRPIDELIEDSGPLEILGMYGIFDPPRQDVKDSIELTQRAGIQVKMITGDHPDTARIIGETIGLKHSDLVMTGREIDETHEDEGFAERLEETGIFARVSPENKLQIVDALRAKNHIVAMTGDGVNDAPALNGSDIGIAMGIRGTEVAKETSDMILTDDRFSTIVEAVEVGRQIFDNIKKFVSFLFTCNLVEITAIFLTVVFLLPMPVAPLHVLYLNLIIDILPAITLSFEPGEPDIMERPPRDPKRGLIYRSFLMQIGLSGVIIGISAFLVFRYFHAADVSSTYAQTAAFSAMAFGQITHIFNVRHPIRFGLDRSILDNKALIGALVASVALLLIAIYVPFMQNIMGTEALSLGTWGFLIAVSAVVTGINFLVKRIINGFQLKSKDS